MRRGRGRGLGRDSGRCWAAGQCWVQGGAGLQGGAEPLGKLFIAHEESPEPPSLAAIFLFSKNFELYAVME